MPTTKKTSHSGYLAAPRLILASRSPRRRRLIRALGIMDCNVVTPKAKEITGPGRNIHQIVKTNALGKAKSVLGTLPKTKAIVIGADTVVLVDGKILGKPKSREEAELFLKKLSNRTHDVVTGLALVSRVHGERTVSVKSQVTFKKLSKKEIDNYISTPEPYDKAGAYGIQGLASLFIKKIHGSYTNVMGFPIEEFLKELTKLTKLSPHYWFLQETDAYSNAKSH